VAAALNIVRSVSARLIGVQCRFITGRLCGTIIAKRLPVKDLVADDKDLEAAIDGDRFERADTAGMR